MTKRLIVNADDYGLTVGVSEGIRIAHLNGIVSTTTAMLNMPSVVEDLLLAHQDCPRLGVGIHLVATAGKPLRPYKYVSTIVNGEGYFRSIRDYKATSSFFEQLDPAQLQDEWRSQIDKFLQLGLNLDHLDSHHHIACYHKKVYEVMIALAEEYDTPIRTILPVPSSNALFGRVDHNILNFFSQFALSLLSVHPIRQPDGFISSFMHQGASLRNLLRILTELPDGTFELMCHPGIVDEELSSVSSYNMLRQAELDALTHKKTRELIESYQIELINFRKI
jgi:predicted glycoside hydrolase/deacetylase ChbG (UPF0249 family)